MPRIETETQRKLSARTEPFDSYWQAPEDVERGYTSFNQYYRANFLAAVLFSLLNW